MTTCNTCCTTTLLHLLSTTDPHSVVSAPMTSKNSASINVITSKIQHCHVSAGLQDKEQQVTMTEVSFKCHVPPHRNCRYTKHGGQAKGAREFLRMLRAVSSLKVSLLQRSSNLADTSKPFTQGASSLRSTLHSLQGTS